VNIAINDISSDTTFLVLHFWCRKYRCIFNHFCILGLKSYKFSEVTQNTQPLRHSRSFKVTDFGTSRKPICDFLLVINSNVPPILHRLQVGRLLDKYLLATGECLTLMPSLGVIRCEYPDKLYQVTSPETRMIVLPDAEKLKTT